MFSLLPLLGRSVAYTGIAIILSFGQGVSLCAADNQQTGAGKNDLPETFEERFSVQGETTVMVENVAELTLREGASGLVVVSIRGSNAYDRVQISRKQNEIAVRGKEGAAGNAISIRSNADGVSISTGASAKNRKIIVNGKEIQPATDAKVAQADGPLSVGISLPAGSDVDLTDVRSVIADVKLKAMKILASSKTIGTFHGIKEFKVVGKGVSDIELKGLPSVSLELSGASKLRLADFQGGKLVARVAGSSSLSASGGFSYLDIVAGGASRVETEGEVREDISAHADGAAKIVHRGSVSGKVEKHEEGAGRIEIMQLGSKTR